MGGLQATQAGRLAAPAYEFNMLRQGVSVGPGSTVGLPGLFIPPGVIVPPGTQVPGTADVPASNLPLLCDFNRDGHTDLLWQDRSNGDILVWLMDGTKVRSKRTIRGRTPKSKQIFGVADFNRDGKTDLVWRTSRGAVGLWLMKGKARLANRPVAQSPRGFRVEGTGDFNGDGSVDILWRNASAGTTGVWLMNGTSFSSSTDIAPGIPAGWVITGTGEFNHDGCIDILLRHPKTGAVGLRAMKGTTVVASTTCAKKPRVWEIRN